MIIKTGTLWTQEKSICCENHILSLKAMTNGQLSNILCLCDQVREPKPETQARWRLKKMTGKYWARESCWWLWCYWTWSVGTMRVWTLASRTPAWETSSSSWQTAPMSAHLSLMWDWWWWSWTNVWTSCDWKLGITFFVKKSLDFMSLGGWLFPSETTVIKCCEYLAIEGRCEEVSGRFLEDEVWWGRCGSGRGRWPPRLQANPANIFCRVTWGCLMELICTFSFR